MSALTRLLQHISGKDHDRHEGTVRTGGSTITNLHFGGDMYGLAGAEELAKLVEHLNKTVHSLWHG